ncbi:alpha/beta-hydrolase [Didymella exigua CBS 183.55]|uniref:Alpha/beta-hydrolase n=1 Tax=Didymella exigua CBS 183.55 TaxID=1150837 RepID=A0A6A5RC59_9PLEO|nr:alpha/beta-hydrolase [Didymella exigua CBS 183.55]KAF1925093.1 alpha/beta-hydrolase [Didymella exigua CBS 183.55]
MALLHWQPFKGTYVLAALGFELLRLPLFIVKYLTSYGRQHPEWTFRQALTTRLIFAFVYHVASIQVNTSTPLTPGAEKERFVRIKPAGGDQYKGPLRINNDVQPVEIGATWYPAPLTASSDKTNLKVVLHIHGGAYVSGDGRTQASGYFAKLLQKHIGATHILMPQYRISSLPASKTSNPFPAALQDSLTAYLYLLNDLRISPSDIILSGDSAGGNASISILRYISEFGQELKLPNPSAALLWSPWIDPSDTSGSFVTDNPNYVTDYLSLPFTLWGSDAYAGAAGRALLSHPYVSHKGKTFKTEVPIFVNTGGGEILYFDDCEWAGKMKGEGNDVTLDVEKKVPHDILLLGNINGFHDEATACAKRAGTWLSSKRK